MSLLMKALEKAAQDRDKTSDKPMPATAAAPVAAAGSALSLEPIEPSFEPATPSNNAMPATGAPRETPRSTATPGTAGAPPRGPTRSSEQTRASVVLSAQPARSANALAWISTHPVPFTAALAGVIAVGYGTYIYLQAAHPSLFLRTPAPQPVVAAKPVAVSPAPVASAPAASTPATEPALIPAQSVFSTRPDSPVPSKPEPAAANTATVPSKATPAPPPTGQIAAPAAASAAPVVSQSRIVVSRGDSTALRVSAPVSDAYAALESGRFDTARPLYEQALRGEPGNIDALLGLAAIAQHENRADDASRYYLRILEVDPRHALAQSGLIALMGRADPQAAETRLKQLLAREPSPPLYFTLGNLYADQGLWSQAQQAYFQAHHLDTGNPDYAYNLAVALEHLGQQKLALGFYRRAVQLAAGRGRSNFNPSQTQARISQLAARLE